MGERSTYLRHVVPARRCAARTRKGEPCRAKPGTESELCFFHDPETAAEAAKARQLGGKRRRRESTVAAAYDLASLDDVEGIRRVLEIAVLDALQLENSIPR